MDKYNLVEKYKCERCDYITSVKCNYDKHLLTAKHKDNITDKYKIVEIYKCDICDYNTSRKYNYDKHLLSSKHNLDNSINSDKSINKEIKCICGKIYKYIQGLSKHKKICNYKPSQEPTQEPSKEPTQEPSQELNQQNIFVQTNINMFIDIIKQNNEFKELLIEQNKQQNQLINKFMERENQIINNNNNSNNTINNQTNNQTFNLNFFLNETCKDAMNVKEFLDNLNPTVDDLENVGEKGFVKGISEIILKSLRGMEITKRPIHCTDIKREVVYLKEDDKWNKDDTNNSKMKELIRKVENKNFCNICEWQNNHPDTRILDSPDYIKQNMLMEKSCEAVNNEDRVRGKVLKELLKEIHINGKQ
jgi:hypothetical protein